MKRRRLVILLASVVLLAAGLTVFYVARVAIYGKQELSGPQAAVPTQPGALAPIGRGDADWPCWRGPNLDGRSAVTGIREDWTGGLQKLWEVDFLCQGKDSVTWSAPVVQGNSLVVPGRDEKNDLVFCLDPENGELIWLGSYEADARTSRGPGARATPFIDDDRVYTFGRDGDLACWDLKAGNLIWRRNVKDAGGKEPTWGHSSSPLVHKDKAFVQGGGKALVLAYDKMSGDIAWKSMEGNAGYAAPTLVDAGEEAKLLVFHGKGLACLDPDDGKELWSVPWTTNYDVNATTPVTAGTTVFITSGYSRGCQALEMMDTEAAVLWRNKAISSQHSDPFIIDGFIYSYSGQSNQNKGYFKCVELKTGEEKWSTGEIGWGTMIHIDGHLLCMDIAGNLFLVRPDPSGFRKVTQFRGALGSVGHPAWTIPIVANGKLYLRYMQRLVCYNLMPQ